MFGSPWRDRPHDGGADSAGDEDKGGVHARSEMKSEESSSVGSQTPLMDPVTPQGVPLGNLAALFARPRVMFALWAAAIFSLVVLAVHLPERLGREDFSSYYTSAWALRSGGNPYTENFETTATRLGLHLGVLRYAVYTPTFLLWFEPLTLLGVRTAYWSWQALNLIALCTAIILLLDESRIGRRRALVLLPLIILYPPLIDHFAYAQCQLLILLMLVLMMRWMERGWDAGAGLLLALAVLLRAFPLILAGYFVLRRRWTVCRWLGFGLIAGAAATWAVVGPRCLDFLYGARFASGYEFLALPVNVSVGAVVSRVFWYALGSHLSPALNATRASLAVAAELLIFGLTVRATVARNEWPDRDWRLFSLWIVATIMLSPTAWLHYMVLLFIPFVELAAAASRGAASQRAAVMAVASYVLSLLSCLGMSCITALSSPQVQSVARGPVWRVLGPGGWLVLAKEECAFVALLFAYVAVYRFALDYAGGPDGYPESRSSAGLSDVLRAPRSQAGAI